MRTCMRTKAPFQSQKACPSLRCCCCWGRRYLLRNAGIAIEIVAIGLTGCSRWIKNTTPVRRPQTAPHPCAVTQKTQLC